MNKKVYRKPLVEVVAMYQSVQILDVSADRDGYGEAIESPDDWDSE